MTRANPNPISGDLITITASADGDLPTQIELMPIGKFSLMGGGGTFDLSDVKDVIASSLALAAGNILPIDFDHGIDGLGSNTSIAAGWITGLTVEGKRLMATVEWSEAGAAALKGKNYRFISPTWNATKKTNKVTRILRAGLTNNPAIHDLAQVASKKGDADMNPLLQQIATALGLKDETDEEKITAAAVTAIGQLDHLAPILAAAGDAEVLDETVATAVVTKMTASASGKPDPSKFVPIAALDEVRTELASLQGTVSANAAATVVTAAMEAGKVTPALKDWATDYASSDPKGFNTWLAAQPVVMAAGELLVGDPPSDDPNTLTAVEKQVCASMGITEDAYLATKTGKPLSKPQKEA